MFGLKRICAGMILGGGIVSFADHYHLLYTAEGFMAIPRAQHAPLRSAFADVRGWDEVKWAAYPELVDSLRADGRAGVMSSSAVADAPVVWPLPSAAPTDVTTPRQPPIVFESPARPPAESLPRIDAAEASFPAAADGSLLGRLSRQLQSAAPAGAVPTADAAPQRTRTQSETGRGAYGGGSTFGVAPGSAPGSAPAPPRPQPLEGRAGIAPEQWTDEDYPSIHSAAMQRVTAEARQAAEEVRLDIGAIRERATSDAKSLLPGRNGASAPPTRGESSRSEEIPWQPDETGRSTVAPRGGNRTDEANLLPLDIDSGRLREHLPSTMRDALHVLTPGVTER